MGAESVRRHLSALSTHLSTTTIAPEPGRRRCRSEPFITKRHHWPAPAPHCPRPFALVLDRRRPHGHDHPQQRARHLQGRDREGALWPTKDGRHVPAAASAHPQLQDRHTAFQPARDPRFSQLCVHAHLRDRRLCQFAPIPKASGHPLVPFIPTPLRRLLAHPAPVSRHHGPPPSARIRAVLFPRVTDANRTPPV
jgi:hypothetical protein